MRSAFRGFCLLYEDFFDLKSIDNFCGNYFLEEIFSGKFIV